MAEGPRPEFSPELALELAAAHWGLTGYTETAPLPSYDDQNLKLVGASPLVLKVAAAGSECRGGAGAAATRAQLEMENAGMHRLAEAGLSVPAPISTPDGRTIVRVEHPNGGDGVASRPVWD